MAKRITTHPKRRARRERALDRFTVDKARAAKDTKYAGAKATELNSLKRSLGHA